MQPNRQIICIQGSNITSGYISPSCTNDWEYESTIKEDIIKYPGRWVKKVRGNIILKTSSSYYRA